MAVSEKTKREIWVKAGGHCSFPDCQHLLIEEGNEDDSSATIGEIAHIVAQGAVGPRSDKSIPGEELHGVGNLMLLCLEHHQIVDDQPKTYPVEKLIQMRTDHEKWVREQLSPREAYTGVFSQEVTVTDTIHSSLIPVSRMPCYIYSAPTKLTNPKEAQKRIEWPSGADGLMLPFILKENQLHCFADLTKKKNPFHKCISADKVTSVRVEQWWNHDAKHLWFVQLLNQCLNKLTGRKGLLFDKRHKRYYFVPDKHGEEVSVASKSLEGRASHRSACWQPKRRSTGEPKGYWEHLAVGLRFHRLSDKGWCLSLRPERRFTIDGFVEIEGKETGKKSTSKKSRMFNIDVLKEVNFWREFLSDGNPRITLNFGEQSMTIEKELLHGDIVWPGVSNDAKPFSQAEFSEDLFSLAELDELDGDYRETNDPVECQLGDTNE